jgi:D-serine deaminase-like pyridoxal phosphate-dependent protein
VTRTLDPDALAALRAEVLDWRHKSIPVALHGRRVSDAAAAGLDLLDDGFGSPVLSLDADAVRHNAQLMARWCRDAGVDLAPHGKTTMSPALLAVQAEAGVWAFTAATAWQARVFRAFGAGAVLIANEVADPAELAWIAAEQRRDPAARIMIWVDSVAGVRLADEALRVAGADRPLDVLLEIGWPGGRGGTRGSDAALAVAAAVRDAPGLRLVGVAGYEGAVAHGVDAASVSAVDAYLHGLRAATERLAALGYLDEADEVVLTAGGSAYFDRVVEVLRPTQVPRPLRLVLRSGCYLTHDHGYYGAVTPGARGVPGMPAFRPALTIWARVSSRPEPGLALLAMGKRDVAYDEGLPLPIAVHQAGHDTAPRPLRGARVAALNDQHAFLRGPEDELPEIGQWVSCGISHPCATFDRWRLVPVVEGTRVVDLAHTFF